ncbi:MAG: aminotransferase class I/II-fold pyridoxal phosphate-dependent enzyme [Anaerolineaceae bacterium]|jgi:methionine-gamma-lyase
MNRIDPSHGLGTLANHYAEGEHAEYAHAMPIFQTSTFEFPDVASGAARFRGAAPGYIYTRLGNPNADQAAAKIAVLEAIDLLRTQPQRAVDEVVGGRLFASGMAAITTALLAALKPGETIITQGAIYSATHNFLKEIAPQYGIRVIWLEDSHPSAWESALRAHPQARLAYVETPSNPRLQLVELPAVAEIAHRYGAWLAVDNTFATPYCQRPLNLGADVVIHSTTKYLSGHGLLIGGCVVSPHLDYLRGPLQRAQMLYGGTPSPFDAWLTSMGLKTFEIRMQRHCQNALLVARFLESHPAVARVHYPGLASHPQHALAQRQMPGFGGMIAFELKGGLHAGIALMERVCVCRLAVSLGTTDTLIEHPASMSHSTVSPEERLAIGISDGLVRLSVGIENGEDVAADLEQAMRNFQNA